MLCMPDVLGKGEREREGESFTLTFPWSIKHLSETNWIKSISRIIAHNFADDNCGCLCAANIIGKSKHNLSKHVFSISTRGRLIFYFPMKYIQADVSISFENVHIWESRKRDLYGNFATNGLMSKLCLRKKFE